MLTALCLAAFAVAAEPFQITFKRDTDRATITAGKDQTVIAIVSPSGISDATIERKTEHWPARVTLRLALRGLEHFQVSNGELRLDAAVSSTSGEIRIWKNGREDAPLKADDPESPQIRRLDDAFEIALPKALFEENPQSITLRWIDFYRN